MSKESFRNFALYGAAILLLQGLAACDATPAEKPLAGAEQAGGEAIKAKQYDKLVVAFGDSLYAGYRLAPAEGFAPQLQAALSKAGINARVHNAGVAGDTTAAGKQRLSFVLDNLERKPDLVILGLGGNDMLRGVKAAETESNLRAMLDELKKRDIPVVLTGMLAAPNLGQDYANAFNPIFPKLAKEYQAKLYPFFLDGVVADPALMLPDHIHPNAKGVATIVEKAAPLIADALK